MANSNPSTDPSRPGPTKLLALLLALQVAGTAGLFAPYVFTLPDRPGLRAFTIITCLLGLLALTSVWLAKPSAIWTTLTFISVKLTIDLFTWTVPLNRSLVIASLVINAAILFLAFARPAPIAAAVTRPQKIFFACVTLLAGWVGYWGLFVPLQVDMALPFKVPPFHARFLGAMYLSAALTLAASLFTRVWPEVRVMVPMISIWTGLLGIVSLLHLDAFNWSRTQVWVWFFAYICFPIIAAWVAWSQRSLTDSPSGPPLSALIRGYLFLQGTANTLLGLSLLFAPAAMVALWPWKIPPVLAHIYSAPFLSFGLGALYAARQQTWSEVRVVVLITLSFAVLVLIGSYLHLQSFNFAGPSAWVWFVGFGVTVLALALFSAVPALRRKT